MGVPETAGGNVSSRMAPVASVSRARRAHKANSHTTRAQNNTTLDGRRPGPVGGGAGPNAGHPMQQGKHDNIDKEGTRGNAAVRASQGAASNRGQGGNPPPVGVQDRVGGLQSDGL